MAEQFEAVRKHVSDQLGLVEHVLEAVRRQRADEAVLNNIEANKVVIEIERTLQDQARSLERLVHRYGAETQSVVKKAVTELLGMAAGLYDRVREDEVSRMLRDDYTALSLVAMGYTAFHTFGLVIGEDEVASVALENLKTTTPLLVKLSKALPKVVADEVAREAGLPVAADVGERALQNTQQAWRHEVTDTP